MEGWCVGVTVAWSHHSCTIGGHTNTLRHTITHTNEQNMHVRGHSAVFRRNATVCLPLFFRNMHNNTGRALTCPSFELFFYAHSPSLKADWSWYLWAGPDVDIIIVIIVIMRFGGRDIRLVRCRSRFYHYCNHQIGLIYDLCRPHNAWDNGPGGARL